MTIYYKNVIIQREEINTMFFSINNMIYGDDGIGYNRNINYGEYLQVLDMLDYFSYKAFHCIHNMICPDRDIYFRTSIYRFNRVESNRDGGYYYNTITIYLDSIIDNNIPSMWPTVIVQVITHELYHSILYQDSFLYIHDKDFAYSVEQQTNYLAMMFIMNNRTTLENLLDTNIDIKFIVILENGESPFVKDILSPIQYINPRDMWIYDILPVSPDTPIPQSVIDNIDKYPNVCVGFKLIVDEYYMGTTDLQIIKDNWVFYFPTRDVSLFKDACNGGINNGKYINGRHRIYSSEKENLFYILVEVNLNNRIPFFIKDKEDVQ